MHVYSCICTCTYAHMHVRVSHSFKEPFIIEETVDFTRIMYSCYNTVPAPRRQGHACWPSGRDKGSPRTTLLSRTPIWQPGQPTKREPIRGCGGADLVGADQAEADKLVRWCLEWLLARGACRAIVYRIGEVAPALRVQQQRTGPRLERGGVLCVLA